MAAVGCANTSHLVETDSFEAPIPEVSDLDDDSLLAGEPVNDDEEEPLFSPPLYIQRYCAVEESIDKYCEENDTRLKSIVDLGCAELAFLTRAKNGNMFQRIVGVDVDEFLVGNYCRRIQPGVCQMINVRDKPLRIEVYAGSVTQPDQRVMDVDVVTAIELIEHMDLPTHADLVINVFDVIQPLLAIFTTPNVEYNPLFPGGSCVVRRHWDHRFEWTRAQFQAWCQEIVCQYPYTVKFDGVGEGPEGTLETYGYCSQIASFTRDPLVPKVKRQISTMPYKLVREVDYPWAPPKTLAEEVMEIIDGECYSLAKELQNTWEARGIYRNEWFTFAVPTLYETRWRLQNMLQPPDHLDLIRSALVKVDKAWLKFTPERDEISYQLLLSPENEDLFEGPDNDVEQFDYGFVAMDPQTEQDLADLNLND